MSRLNKVLQQNNVTEHKKKKAKQKKTVMPVYDMTGKTITPEKKTQRKQDCGCCDSCQSAIVIFISSGTFYRR